MILLDITLEFINRELESIIKNHYSIEKVRVRKTVLLPQFTHHHLGHTFCIRLCEADVHIKVIQTIMGHKDIQTTMDIYAEVTEWKKKASLNEIFEQMKLFQYNEKSFGLIGCNKKPSSATQLQQMRN